MGGTPTTVLVVDDEIDMRILVRVVLESASHGFEVVAEAVDGDEALASFDELDPPPVPTVVILDNRMPGRSGIEVAAEMRKRHPPQRIILFSAFLTPDVEAEARAVGIAACVGKEDVADLPDLVARLAVDAH